MKGFNIRNFEILYRQEGILRKLEYLFWKVLCPYPDQTKIGMWWYGVSGRIAGYFHLKTCKNCQEKKARNIG